MMSGSIHRASRRNEVDGENLLDQRRAGHAGRPGGGDVFEDRIGRRAAEGLRQRAEKSAEKVRARALPIRRAACRRRCMGSAAGAWYPLVVRERRSIVGASPAHWAERRTRGHTVDRAQGPCAPARRASAPTCASSKRKRRQCSPSLHQAFAEFRIELVPVANSGMRARMPERLRA